MPIDVGSSRQIVLCRRENTPQRCHIAATEPPRLNSSRKKQAMKSLRTVCFVMVAFFLGVVTTSLIPGCGTSRAVQGAEPATPQAAEPPVAADTTAVDGQSSSTAGVSKLAAVDKTANAPVKPGDWPQWAGTSYRNNTPVADSTIPTQWEVGSFDRKTGEWISDKAVNIKWVSRVGSQTYGNPVIAGGRLYVGTNNGAGYLNRYPADVDLGCLLCFNEKTGEFLWQDSNEKLPTGRVHDWPLQGICCAPLVEGNRLWYVTSRGEVVCLDTEGFYDGEDDGPLQHELARLFSIRKSEDPAADEVGPATQALSEGTVTPALRQRFTAADMELPDTLQVTTVSPGKKWQISANIHDVERTCAVTLQGPNLSAFKVVTPARQARVGYGLAIRHDGEAACVTAQHVQLLRDGRGGHSLRQYLQWRGRVSHQHSVARRAQFHRHEQAHGRSLLDR